MIGQCNGVSGLGRLDKNGSPASPELTEGFSRVNQVYQEIIV